MRIQAHCFWTHKASNAPADYEDDFDFTFNRRGRQRPRPSPGFLTVQRDMVRPRFAVADGASESSYSGLWAQLLVRTYVACGPRTPQALCRLVQAASDNWSAQTSALSLPWYAQDKLQQGAYATLTGLSLLPPKDDALPGGRWTALAAGDSCLFQVRGAQLISAFPIQSAAEFGLHPELLSTRLEKNGALWQNGQHLRRQGDWRPGDTFLLMTDALAHWFLQTFERGGQPWRTVDQLAHSPQLQLPGPFAPDPAGGAPAPAPLPRDAFRHWIDRQRGAGALHDDDVTLLLIAIGD